MQIRIFLNILSSICLLLVSTCIVTAQRNDTNDIEDRVIVVEELNNDKKKYKIVKGKSFSEKTTTEPKILGLPFVDNFTQVKFDIFENLNMPDTNNWYHSEDVRIYRTTAIDPPDFGTACFDGLRGDGYGHISEKSSQYGYGDSLLSHYINTSTLKEGSDSLILSFYVERGGLAYHTPGSDDTLFVEVRKADGTFQRLGDFGIKNTLTDQFRFVDIALKTREYFHDKLQIKFKTIGSLNGAFDNWHLDYVYLQKNRPENDSAVFDLAIVNSIRNFLTPFTAIPNKYLDTNLVKLKIDSNIVRYRNYGVDLGITGISTTIQDTLGAKKIFISAPERKETTFNPQTIFDQYSGVVVPKNYHKSYEEKENWLLQFTNEIVSIDNDLTNRNDKMIQYVRADSILALDDGEFEMSFGVATPKAIGQRFNILTDDTLRALWLNFQPREALMDTFVPVKFKIGVWYDTLNALIPIYINPLEYIVNTVPDWNRCDNINTFHRNLCKKFRGPNQMVRYQFDQPIGLKKGNFIIGMIQLQKSTGADGGGLLGIGLDKNYNNEENLFYQKDYNWKKLGFKGTLGIRLELSSILGSVSREEIRPSNDFVVYPNPNSERNLYVSSSQNFKSTTQNFKLSDFLGRVVFQTNKTNNDSLIKLELPKNLVSGIYSLLIESNNSQNGISTICKKIIIE